jgi:hypothetical protein
MLNTVLFRLADSGQDWIEYSAFVSLKEQGEFMFNRKVIESLDIKVREFDSPSVCTQTSVKGRCLELMIPLLPEQFGQFEENPTATFEIVNDFELDDQVFSGVKFDKWIVKGHGWSRDVYNEQGIDLEGRALFTCFAVEAEEPIAA